jgi:hypothetical protein
MISRGESQYPIAEVQGGNGGDRDSSAERPRDQISIAGWGNVFLFSSPRPILGPYLGGKAAASWSRLFTSH